MRIIGSSAVIFLFLILSLLCIPIAHIVHNNTNFPGLMFVVIGSFSMPFFILSLYYMLGYLNKYLALLIIISSTFCIFLVRVILAGLYDFSGRGFSSEFFAHFGWQSFVVGFSDYGTLLVFVIVILVLIAVLLVWLLNKCHTPKFFVVMSMLIPSSILVAISIDLLPVGRLINTYVQYDSIIVESADKITIRRETGELLEPLRYGRSLPVEKIEIIARPSSKPKDVIIIYLESFSEILTQSDIYPGLTPNLDRLKNENISFENNFSSGYVTIEGIANSQCGTLMNMDNGNNSLTNAAGRLQNLPCMGDVLHEAGYKQVFYGGAGLDFAGKGSFFSEHGYDEVHGMRSWREKGFSAVNNWGLSDENLFDEALSRVLDLKKGKQPFNLTLLTLGTHIPGFLYEGCNKYSGKNHDSLFIDAIHCTDQLVGKFVAELSDSDFLKDTIIYIQGDHAIFSTHAMKELFFEQSVDKRVLTIVLDPDKDNLIYDTKYPTSTVNMAANVLDLLDVEHNVDFIFSRSDFNDSVDNPYLLTRYDDYHGINKVLGVSETSSCENVIELSIPLNHCEKKLAMKSIYRLGASYSREANNLEMCHMGVEVSVDNDSKKIFTRWGDKDLSESFYFKGHTFKDIRKGFYLLLLNEKDKVVNQFFYSQEAKELKKLNEQIGVDGARFLLFSNLSSVELNVVKGTNIPDSFPENNILYAKNVNGKIISLINKNYDLGTIAFIPESCGDFKLVMHKNRGPEREELFCDIDNWGPRETLSGVRFNELADGRSAFWIKTNCAPDDVVIRLDGRSLDTVRRIPVITAGMYADKFLQGFGEYPIELYDKKSKAVKHIGFFKVMRNENVQYAIPETKSPQGVLAPPVLLAHAGGGYKGRRYMNSIESLDFNYSLGHRLFELDFSWTNDNNLVAIHDWKNTYKRLFDGAVNEIPSLQEFNDLAMRYGQTQIDLLKLSRWLRQHSDAYVVTDVKGHNVKALKLMSETMGGTEKQIIPQLYHPTNYNKLINLGYKDIIFTLYATHLSTDELITFIKGNPLFATTIDPKKEGFNEILKALVGSNKFVYVHTYNTISELEYYLSLGVNGIYTDFLYVDDGLVERQ